MSQGVAESDPALPPGGGLLLVDKPAGPTSHDVVARLRRILGTRRIGHAGTLDPAATGLLVIAVGRSTRLLGHLALTTKSYDATIRLGWATDTDDAEGRPASIAPAGAVEGITDASIDAGLAALTGDLLQVPSAVSAIKIDGRRAYQRVRAGEEVSLPARPVTVHRLELVAQVRRGAVNPADADPGGGSEERRGSGSLPAIDLDVRVDCSSGTYIRALARDLGAALGTGGHLIRLRRTRVGPFPLADAVDVFGPERAPDERLRAVVTARIIPAAEAARVGFAARPLDESQVAALRHGRPIAAIGLQGVYAGFAPDGRLVALVREGADGARPVLGWLAGG